ncbi:hypothetical protein HYU19_02140 [Candidatus Woesearchaeota archaeon]|nr:hypothetical protein [Candidatus Woesearchaeota archaeon]
MKISIDTKEDSPDDIRRVVALLSSLAGLGVTDGMAGQHGSIPSSSMYPSSSPAYHSSAYTSPTPQGDSQPAPASASSQGSSDLFGMFNISGAASSAGITSAPSASTAGVAGSLSSYPEAETLLQQMMSKGVKEPSVPAEKKEPYTIVPY